MNDPKTYKTIHNTSEEAYRTNRFCALAFVVIFLALACLLAAVLILAAKGML